MGRAKDAADRIRAEVPIVDVLYEYGYHVHPEGDDREQQFSCDLHGDGADTKPSARVYPESASFHCFACGRSRDAITLVREKEGIDFWPAVKALEARYGLDPLPWEGPEEPRNDKAVHKINEALEHTTETPEQLLNRISRIIDSCCRERSIPAERCAAFWEAHDKVDMAWRENAVPEATVKAAASKVLRTVREYLGVASAQTSVHPSEEST
ncbi:MAG: hypothetical protein CMJ67_10685 [Planctomycetaceae bacterium]|nr:hypothetical protein [Planctomycetaceae bacterium]